MRLKIISSLLVGLLLLTGACGSKNPKTSFIKIQIIGTDLIQYWKPSTVAISVGGTVTWMNTGPDTRSVISDQGLFNSDVSPGQSFQYTFKQAGTFTFHDEPNIETNTIIVE